jgi:hypothetical protein
MARPEGFEPPTLRSDEGCGSYYQLFRDNARLILLHFLRFAHLTKAQISQRDGHILDTLGTETPLPEFHTCASNRFPPEFFKGVPLPISSRLISFLNHDPF